MEKMLSDHYLAHHGILGQKWGVRRYQNKDGTLTAAGKKRYGDTDNVSIWKRRKLFRTKSKSKPVEKQETPEKKKRVSEMTNEELNAAIERMRLEKTYNEYVSAMSPKKKRAGKEFVKDILKASGKKVGIELATYAMGKTINTALGTDVINLKKSKKKDKDKDEDEDE